MSVVLSLALCFSPSVVLGKGDDARKALEKASKTRDYGSYGRDRLPGLMKEPDGLDQYEHQDDGKENKGKGADQASMLGMGLAGIGTALIAMGMAKNRSCRCGAGTPKIMKGRYFLAGSAGSFATSMLMKKDSDQGSGFQGDLRPLPPLTLPPPGGETPPGGKTPSSGGERFVVTPTPNPTPRGRNPALPQKFSFKVDDDTPDSLRSSLEQLEDSHGIDAEELLAAIAKTKGNADALENLFDSRGFTNSVGRIAGAGDFDPTAAQEEYASGVFDEYKELAALSSAKGLDGDEISGAKKKSGGSIDDVIKGLLRNKGGPKDLGKKRNIASVLDKKKVGTVTIHDRDRIPSMYRGKTIFERISDYYRTRASEFYVIDYFLREGNKKKTSFLELEDSKRGNASTE